MTIIVKSKIERGYIRLPKKVRLPEGMRVMVRIEPILKTREKKRSFQNYVELGLMIPASCLFLKR